MNDILSYVNGGITISLFPVTLWLLVKVSKIDGKLEMLIKRINGND